MSVQAVMTRALGRSPSGAQIMLTMTTLEPGRVEARLQTFGAGPGNPPATIFLSVVQVEDLIAALTKEPA